MIGQNNQGFVDLSYTAESPWVVFTAYPDRFNPVASHVFQLYCSTSVLPENPVFGVPVDVAVQRSILVDGVELPTVFRQCIDFLEERGVCVCVCVCVCLEASCSYIY